MNRRAAGFSLIEILVVVSLISIMLVIAVPSFVSFISNYRATAAINEILQSVTQTRNEALKQGRKVILLPKDSANIALTTYSSTGSWTNGWAVFQYACSLSGYDALSTVNPAVFVHPAAPASVVISGAGTTLPFNGLNYLGFDGSGYPRTAGVSCNPPPTNLPIAATNNGIAISNKNGSSVTARTLCISIMGRPRIVQSLDVCLTG